MSLTINPSLADNFPYTVMESLACGTPVLAFNTGGIPELVQHKKSGYIAEYENEDDLYDGLVWLIEKADLKAMGEFGSEDINQRCNPAVVADKHIDFYKYILGKE